MQIFSYNINIKTICGMGEKDRQTDMHIWRAGR